MIHGVTLFPLRRFSNGRGTVSQMMRVTDPSFTTFGEIYFSSVPSGIQKDWRLHQSLTMSLAVPIGTVRFALFDPRETSPTYGTLTQYDIGDENYQLLTIPNGIWMTFVNQQLEVALIANCATEPHDSNEVIRRAVDDPPVPFSWG